MIKLFILFSLLNFSCSISAEYVENQYIIKLKPGISSSNFVRSLSVKSADGVSSALNDLTLYVYNTVYNGFAAKLDESQLKLLKSYSEIEAIEQDQIVSLTDERVSIQHAITQLDAQWGLARSSQRQPVNGSDSFNYTYLHSAGEGVTIYVIDTGVYIEHDDFGGRAVFGANFILDESDDDLHGHGTHIAGTAAGTLYGTAKNAEIVGVKVLNINGSGTMSGIIAGVDWAADNATSKRPRVVINMSLGGSSSEATNEAVNNAVKSGVTVVVAAGNGASDACTISPAGAELAITVSASDIDDIHASFSNFGSCTNIYAPGVNVTSAIIGSPDASFTASGTSCSSPHVAGIVAYFIGEFKLESVDAVKYMLYSYATVDALSSVPVNTNTPNLLAYNGVHETYVPLLPGGSSIVKPQLVLIAIIIIAIIL